MAHRVLAQVYPRLGLTDLGERHARSADDAHRRLRERFDRLLTLCSAAQLEALPGALTRNAG